MAIRGHHCSKEGKDEDFRLKGAADYCEAREPLHSKNAVFLPPGSSPHKCLFYHLLILFISRILYCTRHIWGEFSVFTKTSNKYIRLKIY